MSDERGAATTMVVACLSLLLALGAALGVVAAMVRDHRVAQSAADLAALAGAAALQRGDDGCAAAGSVAAANGARLAGCRTDGVRRGRPHGGRRSALARPAGRPRGGGAGGAGVQPDGGACSSRSVEQGDGAGLVEGLVLVAALRRLHARGAAVEAAAVADGVARGAQPGRRLVVAALREAGAAGMPVVDEDREPAGVRVQRGRDAADVPPVAGGEQRQQPDRAVLGGVGGARQVAAGDPRLVEGVVGHRPPDGRGAQRPLRQVERLLADHLAGGPALEERDDLVGHVDLAGGEPALAPQLVTRSDAIVMEVTSRAEVVWSGSLRSITATRSSRSRSCTTQVSPACT